MSGRSVLRSRDVRLVLGGGFVNDLGDWLLIIALPVYVFTETASGLATGLLFLVEMVPAVLLGSVAGSFVDRWDLRRTIIVTNVLQAVTLLPLLVVTPDRVWPAFVVARVQSVLTRFGNPAVGALVPRLVGPSSLAAANAAIAVAANLARLIGSPLGGLVVEVGGLRAVVVADGLTYLAVAAATSRVRPVPVVAGGPPTGDGLDVAPGVRAGLRVIRRNPPLLAVTCIVGVSQFAQGLFLVLYIAFVVRVLGGGGGEVGLLRGVQAVGGVAGGVLISRRARTAAPGRLIGWGFLAMGLIAAGTWNLPELSTWIGFYVVGFVAAGAPAVAGSVGVTTATQLFTPPAALGRVIGTGEAVAALGAAAGVLLAGALVDRVGVRPMLDVQAAAYVGCGVAGLLIVARASPSRHGVTDAVRRSP